MFKSAHDAPVVLAPGWVEEGGFVYGQRKEATTLAAGHGLAGCSPGEALLRSRMGAPLVSGWKRAALSTRGPVPQERTGEQHSAEKDN